MYGILILLFESILQVFGNIGELEGLDHLVCQFECSDNVSKEKYVFTIFPVQITLYIISQLNGFYE